MAQKDAKPSTTIVTNLNTWQRTADNQRKRRNHKDISSVAKRYRVPQQMKIRSSQKEDSKDEEDQKGFVEGSK